MFSEKSKVQTLLSPLLKGLIHTAVFSLTESFDGDELYTSFENNNNKPQY